MKSIDFKNITISFYSTFSGKLAHARDIMFIRGSINRETLRRRLKRCPTRRQTPFDVVAGRGLIQPGPHREGVAEKVGSAQGQPVNDLMIGERPLDELVRKRQPDQSLMRLGRRALGFLRGRLCEGGKPAPEEPLAPREDKIAPLDAPSVCRSSPDQPPLRPSTPMYSSGRGVADPTELSRPNGCSVLPERATRQSRVNSVERLGKKLR